MKSQTGRAGAFTLAEVMIASGVTAVILAGFISAVIALQRSFAAADAYAAAHSEQTRVLDYVTRDVRQARAISVVDATTLDLTLPAYIASGSVVSPTLSKGSVRYSSNDTTIRYALDGSRVTRTENGGAGLIIADKVTGFAPVLDPADSSGKTLLITVSFSPKFQRVMPSSSSPGASLSCRTVMRN